MIDRTTFDLRIAEHHNLTARAERQGWQRQGTQAGRTLRVALAGALVALAARLDPSPVRDRRAVAPAAQPSAV